MEATRARFRWLVEWLFAAALLAGALGVGSLMLRESRSVRAVTPVIADEPAAPAPPAGVPPRAVSVPLLVLPDGREVRVGEPARPVIARLGADTQVGADLVERDGTSERITRFYNYSGRQFVLVLEHPTRSEEAHIAAIFVQ